MVLLVGYDDIDVVRAAKAVVRHGKKAVSIGRQVYMDYLRTLIRDDIEETGVLVSKAVVVLSPDCGSEEDIEGGYFDTPLDFVALLDPFAVLVDH